MSSKICFETLAAALLLGGCNVVVQDGTDQDEATQEGLSAEALDAFDRAQSVAFDFDTITLEAGANLGIWVDTQRIPRELTPYDDAPVFDLAEAATPAERKQYLVNRMVAEAVRVARYIPPFDQPPGQTKPGYSLGQKDPFKAAYPPVGGCGVQAHRSEAIYGIDSSGLVSLSVKAAGIERAPDRTEQLCSPKAWKDVIPADWGLAMQAADPRDGHVFGDLLCWRGHIGVASAQRGDPMVIQSHGSDGIHLGNKADPEHPNKKIPKSDSEECTSNHTTRRGPSQYRLTDIEDPTWPLGPIQTVMRLVETE